MQEIKLYRLTYEDGEYCVGTENEVINEHNQWVKQSGRFVEKAEDSCEFDKSDLIENNLATTIQDLEEHWTVEQFYTVTLDKDMLEAIKRRVSNAIGFRKTGLQSIPMHRDRTYTSEDLIEILDSILEDVEAAIEDTIKENINGKSVV